MVLKKKTRVSAQKSKAEAKKTSKNEEKITKAIRPRKKMLFRSELMIFFGVGVIAIVLINVMYSNMKQVQKFLSLTMRLTKPLVA